jgi:hypothetical protein
VFRYDLIWLEIAEQQYLDLPSRLREPVDVRLAQLRDDPTVDPDVTYNERADQWSVPVDDEGFLVYAVVPTAFKVIILRLVVGLI